MHMPMDRQHKILVRAREAGRVEVNSLASELNVAAETVRRDLRELTDRGLVQRVHGGAYAVESAGFESSVYQATLGKMMLGLRVTDLHGKRISIGRAVGRYFAKILSAVILCIGFIMAAFTQKKQALHDLIAGTLVVRK